jgi:hypothetical protein
MAMLTGRRAECAGCCDMRWSHLCSGLRFKPPIWLFPVAEDICNSLTQCWSHLCSAFATCSLSSSCTAVLSDAMASSNLPRRSSAMPLQAHSTQRRTSSEHNNPRTQHQVCSRCSCRKTCAAVGTLTRARQSRGYHLTCMRQ